MHARFDLSNMCICMFLLCTHKKGCRHGYSEVAYMYACAHVCMYVYPHTHTQHNIHTTRTYKKQSIRTHAPWTRTKYMRTYTHTHTHTHTHNPSKEQGTRELVHQNIKFSRHVIMSRASESSCIRTDSLNPHQIHIHTHTHNPPGAL